MSLLRRYHHTTTDDTDAEEPDPSALQETIMTTPLTHIDVLQQIAETLARVQERAQQGTDVTTAVAQMTATLSELAHRTRPENLDHPGISAYSYPEGDVARPKPPLKCDMYWVGYPLDRETQTPEEIEALNRLEPGTYRVTKANGLDIAFTVEGRRKQNGDLESLWIAFPCKGDQSTDHRSMVAYCREAMGETVPTIEALQAQVSALRAALNAH